MPTLQDVWKDVRSCELCSFIQLVFTESKPDVRAIIGAAGTTEMTQSPCFYRFYLQWESLKRYIV